MINNNSQKYALSEVSSWLVPIQDIQIVLIIFFFNSLIPLVFFNNAVIIEKTKNKVHSKTKKHHAPVGFHWVPPPELMSSKRKVTMSYHFI